jgi:hypothetical protein
MLNDYIQKVNSWVKSNKSDLFIASIIFLVSLASFGLGRLSVLWPEKEPIRITNNQDTITQSESDSNSAINESAALVSSIQGEYVASKNGVAYHYPWCSGALRIKEENKVWFETKEAAEQAGYRPAANCEGL